MNFTLGAVHKKTFAGRWGCLVRTGSSSDADVRTFWCKISDFLKIMVCPLVGLNQFLCGRLLWTALYSVAQLPYRVLHCWKCRY